MVSGRMGLLDDAIREHLELKRLRGADPSEVSREEQDALGPVPREADGEERGGEADGQQVPDGLPSAGIGRADDSRGGVGQETLEINMAAELEGDASQPPSAPRSPGSAAPIGHPAHLRSDAQDSLEWEMPGDRQAAELGEPPQDEQVDEEPVDDVLEETPDFLRETPEHERLWFEQQPPRDFDFDE